MISALPAAGWAFTVPGAADVGKDNIQRESLAPLPLRKEEKTDSDVDSAIPENTKNVRLTLERLEIRGSTIFPQEDFVPLYTGYLHQDITLDKVWQVAAQITRMYRDKGYFLSRAYIPVQTIQNGHVIIEIAEGYVAAVDVPDEELAASPLIQDITRRITAERPLNIDTLESLLLRLNDLPGVSLRSVIEPSAEIEGAAKITLARQESRPQFSLRADNSGSRYTGNNEISAQYGTSLIPFQETQIYALGTIPLSELKYVNLRHRIPLDLDNDFIAQFNHSRSHPGFRLKSFRIDGESTSISAGFSHNFIRQRDENLNATAMLTLHNTATDLLDTPLVRDRIRTFSLNARYDAADRTGGVNTYDGTLTQGLSFLHATERNALYPSRGHLKPDFTKLELRVSRWQPLFDKNWNILVSAYGQKANSPLYSSEEIGFGGPLFGRAYDPSEITGNQGIMGMAEVHYTNFPSFYGIAVEPFVFYDIGKVWNDAAEQAPVLSAASAGIGINASYEMVSAGLVIAKPLTKKASSPPHGDGEAPRYLFNILVKY